MLRSDLDFGLHVMGGGVGWKEAGKQLLPCRTIAFGRALHGPGNRRLLLTMWGEEAFVPTLEGSGRYGA